MTESEKISSLRAQAEELGFVLVKRDRIETMQVSSSLDIAMMRSAAISSVRMKSLMDRRIRILCEAFADALARNDRLISLTTHDQGNVQTKTMSVTLIKP